MECGSKMQRKMEGTELHLMKCILFSCQSWRSLTGFYCSTAAESISASSEEIEKLPHFLPALESHLLFLQKGTLTNAQLSEMAFELLLLLIILGELHLGSGPDISVEKKYSSWLWFLLFLGNFLGDFPSGSPPPSPRMKKSLSVLTCC